MSHSSKAKKIITRLRYCLSPLSPTILFQIQILFLSAGVNTAGTVGDIYFSIHDDIRPFNLPLHLKKQIFLSHFYFLPKDSIIFLARNNSGGPLGKKKILNFFFMVNCWVFYVGCFKPGYLGSGYFFLEHVLLGRSDCDPKQIGLSKLSWMIL